MSALSSCARGGLADCGTHRNAGASLPESVFQDVAAEIVNIVGNNLRTFLIQQAGVYFEIGNAVIDDGAETLEAPITFNLDFELNPEALLSLGFRCGEGIEARG
jgi:hypothetical protein